MEYVNSRRAKVLLIEDDPGDQELTVRALNGGILRTDLQIVSDGEKALDYLHQRREVHGLDGDALPDLILLDLNMPNLDGRDVLKQIKGNTLFRHIPIVVLTTSKQETDIVRSYDLGCNAYITKPVEASEFIKAIQELESYWFELVTLPGQGGTYVADRRR